MTLWLRATRAFVLRRAAEIKPDRGDSHDLVAQSHKGCFV
jgi:hypothetical protein